jgi:dynein light intermediate chain 2
MVDLSKPQELWFTLETLINVLQNHLDIALKSQEASNHEIEEKMKKLLEANSDAEHPDKDIIRPFPVPLIILAGRYDNFQNIDPEKKKIICKALRFFAHYHGASLQFYR